MPVRRAQRILLAVLALLLLPALATARTRVRLSIPQPPAYEVAASVEPGLFAGTLVLSFHATTALELPIRVVADTIQYDWLTVELSNASTTRTLTFVADREKSVIETVTLAPGAVHVERIELDALTRDLPPGEYDVRVTWDGHVTTTKLTTVVPLRCGLTYRPPPSVPASPASKWPYALGAVAVLALVGAWLARRTSPAGTIEARVPSSTP